MDIYQWPKSKDVTVAFRVSPLMDIVINYSEEKVSYSVSSECEDSADIIPVVETDWDGNIL